MRAWQKLDDSNFIITVKFFSLLRPLTCFYNAARYNSSLFNSIMSNAFFMIVEIIPGHV